MRTLLIAVLMIALVVGAWLATHYSRGVEAIGSQNQAAVATLTGESESDAPTAALPDDASANVDGPVGSSAPEATSGAGGRGIIPFREPEFRGALVDYLVRSGLSKTDSERVADAAIEGVTKCIALDPARAAVVGACQSAMWQQIGLNEGADRRAIMANFGRELSRRHALEAAAAAAR